MQLVNYDETPIDLIAKNYKTEIDQDQLKVIEGTMKELREDKRVIVEELSRTTSLFIDKHSKQLKKVENLKLTKDYDPATLLLKLKMSPPDKVAALRDAYLTLNSMADEELIILREEKALKNKLTNFVKEKNLDDFVGKLKEVINSKKSQVRAAFVKPKGRSGSIDRTTKRGNIFDRRRSSDELAPSPKPGIRC